MAHHRSRGSKRRHNKRQAIYRRFPHHRHFYKSLEQASVPAPQPASHRSETALEGEDIYDIFEDRPNLAYLIGTDGIRTLGDLVSRTEEDLLSIWGLGPVRLKIIKEVLARYGQRLAIHKDSSVGRTTKEVGGILIR